MKAKLPIILLIFSLIITSSCDKWLNVSSKTDIVSEQMFSDVTGFNDAVVGVYVKMAKPELYSQEMTWRTVEFLSHQYAEVAGAPDLNVPKYLWETAPLPTKRETMWLGMYNAIANVNQILKYQEQNREVFAADSHTDSLIKGEMLALRAFLHFDIMRLFGKGNLENRPELRSAMTIPYVTEFTRIATHQRSYTETLALMKQDIQQAIEYLKCDPCITSSSDFSTTSMSSRRFRMNYWAAKAVYARILMWEGTPESKELALTQALEVMGQNLSGGIGTGTGAYYSWTTSSSVNQTYWYTSDLSFTPEHLFTLWVEKFIDIQKGPTDSRSWFDCASPNNQYSVVYLTDARRKVIYEEGTGMFDADWRCNKCLWAAGATLTNWTIAKFYNVADMSTNYSKRMPMIRVTEMYYIAAECFLAKGDKASAVACLNKVRNQRNIPTSYNLSASLSVEDIKNQITKEYLKEFVGEGQLFFYYKRLGFSSILDYSGVMTDSEYQMPMPDSEMINGGSRVN